jgi:hypothetical protein
MVLLAATDALTAQQLPSDVLPLALPARDPLSPARAITPSL